MCMAIYSLYCAEVPLRNCLLPKPRKHSTSPIMHKSCDLCIIGDLQCILGNNALYASAELDCEQSLVTDNHLSQVTTLHSLQATASWPGGHTAADTITQSIKVMPQRSERCRNAHRHHIRAANKFGIVTFIHSDKYDKLNSVSTRHWATGWVTK